MSYDLAVWEGPMPTSDEAALAEFERLMDWMEGLDLFAESDAPTPAIRSYVESLLARWPDLGDDDEDEESPWADAPLINNARGPVFYFSMVWSKAEEASAFAAATATAQGLVCFDPQSGTLLRSN